MCNNEIEEIDLRSFENLSNLKLLKLNNNRLKRIDRNCFSLKSIDIIQLYDNDFKVLSFFNQFTKLHVFDYDKTKLDVNGFITDWNVFLDQFE